MKIHSTTIPVNIINLYAPRAGHSAQTKMELYNLAHQLTQEIPSHSIKIIVGYFNARLIEALHEQHLIGAHVCRAENNSIHDLTNEQIDNRHNFIIFCLENNLVPMNTWFQKPKPKLATYRNATAPVFDLEQIDSTKFAQIDYVLINSAWKNAVTNVENVHHTIINSDHALLIATLKVKPATKKRFKLPTNIKDREPTSAQIEAYNESFRQIISKAEARRILAHTRQGRYHRARSHTSRQATSHKGSHNSKERLSIRPYLATNSSNRKAIEAGNLYLLPQLNKDIKRYARQGRETATIRRLEEADAQGYKWEGLKAARKTFQPRRTKFKNKHGQIIKESDFADEAATYLETVQWAPPADDDLNLSYEDQYICFEETCMTDDHVLKTQKHGKTPRPDNCPAEFFQWLNHGIRHILLECFNDILDRDIYPESFKLTNVVSIYKKGGATQMKKYRPIALLQTLYKILAGLIKNRLLQTYDPWIQRSQFGFRRKKSTAQAIFLARRLMDISERTGSNLSLVLLDWKVAFDKVNQAKLLQALRRLKVPPRMLKTIEHIYSSPKFRVATGGHSSNYRTQRSGIRQGCPLSPYLFVILMSTHVHDIKQRLTTPKQKNSKWYRIY